MGASKRRSRAGPTCITACSLSAQRSEQHEEQDGHYYRRERSWDSQSRRVALPGVVKDAPVDATLKDGGLVLRIPLPEQAGPKQIEIKSA